MKDMLKAYSRTRDGGVAVLRPALDGFSQNGHWLRRQHSTAGKGTPYAWLLAGGHLGLNPDASPLRPQNVKLGAV